jgi:RNA polymerase sigma-70 factor (ECF subfamily)
VSGREIEWAGMMRAAIDGDPATYTRLLRELTPFLRAFARRGLARGGASDAEAEDVVQETLLAIHLKRQTWDPGLPIGPWIQAIARHKLIDALRRRGRSVQVPIDDLVDLLPAPAEPETVSQDIAKHVDGLPTRQRDVVRAIAVDGRSIGEAAAQLTMNEGAVRVALHRGLAALAAKLRH